MYIGVHLNIISIQHVFKILCIVNFERSISNDKIDHVTINILFGLIAPDDILSRSMYPLVSTSLDMMLSMHESGFLKLVINILTFLEITCILLPLWPTFMTNMLKYQKTKPPKICFCLCEKHCQKSMNIVSESDSW